MRILLIHIISLFLLASMLNVFSSCRQEIDIDVTDTIEDLPIELINTNISGQVINKDNKPLKEVKISIRDQEMVTDINGYFIFENIKADKNGTHIIASKSGYFQNIITVYPTLNNSLFSSIILNEKSESATLLSAEGGSLELINGNTIHIAPNTLVYDSNGSNFEGTAYFNLNLTYRSNEYFTNIFSGEMVGLNAEDQRVGLDPKAFLQIEAKDENGNELRLAKGQTAEVSISLEDMNDPLTSMPMWHFNPDKKRWTYAGLATHIEENFFIVEISSLNEWSLAPSFEAIVFKGSIQYPMQDATRHTMIFRGPDESHLAQIQTNETGQFAGYIPANTDLRLEILNECNELVFEEEIGSFDQATSFDREISESEKCRVLPVSGTLVKCDGQPVTSGYVKLMSFENTGFFRTDADGNYDGHFKICDADGIQISGIDDQTNAVSYTHENLGIKDSVNIGTWSICEDLQGSISIQFLNTYQFLNEELTFQESAGAILFSGRSKEQYFDCTIPSFHGVGTYFIESAVEAEFIFSVLPENADGLSLFPKDSMSYHTFKLEVTEYMEGERIKGRIEGLVRDENNNNIDGMVNIRFDVPGF